MYCWPCGGSPSPRAWGCRKPAHLANMTHASMTPEARQRADISDGLIRLSVGIEDPEDLVEDFFQALEAPARVNGWHTHPLSEPKSFHVEASLDPFVGGLP